MCYINTMTYLISINGCPTPLLPVKSGVRQEDPLSSYLFVLVMDYFTRPLKSLRLNSTFKFHPKCLNHHIIQFNFVTTSYYFVEGIFRPLVSCMIASNSFYRYLNSQQINLRAISILVEYQLFNKLYNNTQDLY